MSAPSHVTALTPKQVWFVFYQAPLKASFPYHFNYNSSTNYTYNPKAYDRWGNYKPNNPGSGYTNYNGSSAPSSTLLTSEAPLFEQDSVLANQYAQAWNLSQIILPSGHR